MNPSTSTRPRGRRRVARALLLLHAGATLGLVPSFVLCVEANGRTGFEIADSKGNCATEYNRRRLDPPTLGDTQCGGEGCVDLAVTQPGAGEVRRELAAAVAETGSPSVAHHPGGEGAAMLAPRRLTLPNASPPGRVVLQI
jgi:hypothetical protein